MSKNALDMGERGRMPLLGCARQSRQPIDGPARDGRKSAELCRALRQQERSPTLYDLHSTFSSFIAPFFLDPQGHLDHPPDCFRPRWLIGLLLSPFVDAGCECWRHT